MKKSKYTEEQIVFALKEHQRETKVEEDWLLINCNGERAEVKVTPLP